MSDSDGTLPDTGEMENSTKSPNLATKPALLALPAELRNQIYEYVAHNETSISIRDGRILYCPALSLVCHQTRKEYESIFLGTAPTLDVKINIHITDFIRTDLSASIRRIESFEETSSPRSYAIRVFVTNRWHVSDLRMFCAGAMLNHGYEMLRYPQKWKREYDIQIHFDPKTFDMDACQKTLGELNDEISKIDVWWFLKEKYDDWPRVEKAFWDALELCGSMNDNGGFTTRPRISADEHMSRVKRRRLRAPPPGCGRYWCSPLD